MSRKDREALFGRTLRFHMEETTRLDSLTHNPLSDTSAALRLAILIVMGVLVLLFAGAAVGRQHDSKLRKPSDETELRGERMGGQSRLPR